MSAATDSAAPLHGQRLIGLDVVRSAAILLVVFAHYFGPLNWLGAYGVELFFALSGYLIGGILLRLMKRADGWSLAVVWNFWLRRWWRTLPNYFLFLLVMLGYHAWFGGLPGWLGFMPYLVFGQNMAQGELGFFGVSWSLCIEEWFYLLFPLLVWLAARLVKSLPLAFGIALGLMIVLPTLARGWAGVTGFDAFSLQKRTPWRLDSIAYGVLALVVARGCRLEVGQRRLLALLGLGLLIAGVIVRLEGMSGSALLAVLGGLLPVLGCALLMPWAEVFTAISAGSWLARWCVRVSVLSYSIYLCHMPVQRVVYAAFGEWREMPLVNALSKLLALLVTWGVASAGYELFERKMTARRPAEL